MGDRMHFSVSSGLLVRNVVDVTSRADVDPSLMEGGGCPACGQRLLREVDGWGTCPSGGVLWRLRCVDGVAIVERALAVRLGPGSVSVAP